MTRQIFRCSTADVLTAFHVVNKEIRNKCHRYARNGLTQGEACELAGRIKEQRELIRQFTARRNARHARRLMRLNRRMRNRLVTLVERAGLSPEVLIFK